MTVGDYEISRVRPRASLRSRLEADRRSRNFALRNAGSNHVDKWILVILRPIYEIPINPSSSHETRTLRGRDVSALVHVG